MRIVWTVWTVWKRYVSVSASTTRYKQHWYTRGYVVVLEFEHAFVARHRSAARKNGILHNVLCAQQMNRGPVANGFAYTNNLSASQNVQWHHNMLVMSFNFNYLWYGRTQLFTDSRHLHTHTHHCIATAVRRGHMCARTQRGFCHCNFVGNAVE